MSDTTSKSGFNSKLQRCRIWQDADLILENSIGDTIPLTATLKYPVIPALPVEKLKLLIETELFSAKCLIQHISWSPARPEAFSSHFRHPTTAPLTKKRSSLCWRRSGIVTRTEATDYMRKSSNYFFLVKCCSTIFHPLAVIFAP